MEQTSKIEVVCVCGPTAGGKTALSLLLAQQLQGEIISADSMQLYRGFDIGTAKPTAAEQALAPHYMIDLCEATQSYSVAQYVEDADRCVQLVRQRGKLPIIVGGTGLYMDALLQGNTFSGGEHDGALRQKYEQMAKDEGNLAVHRCLAQVDPVAAARLHPNNLKRVIRALEVYYTTGQTLDALNAQNRRNVPKYRALKIGLCPSSREILYERINRRVDEMMAEGLLREVRGLYENGLLCGTAGQAIGYKEFLPYFEGKETLETCIEILKKNSRNYAKRQLTWLKRDKDIHWLTVDSAEEIENARQETTKLLRALDVK